ncbi:unnamed protein product [Ascophyllum nodosum]
MAMFPPGCFACHVDCATGCADDQPYNHPYALTTNYEADENAVDENRPSHPDSRSTTLHTKEASAVMRFVLWVLDVKTDTSF